MFIGRVDPEVVPMYSDIATAMIAPFADNPELELTIPAKISSCMASSKPILAVMRGEGPMRFVLLNAGLYPIPQMLMRLLIIW